MIIKSKILHKAFICLFLSVGFSVLAEADQEVYYHLSLRELKEVVQEKLEDIDKRIEEKEHRERMRTREERAEKRFEAGKKLYENGNFQRAYREIDQAMRLTSCPDLTANARELRERINERLQKEQE